MTLLLISLFFLACSILIFFDLRAPLLWKMTIAATEFGHLFVAAPLLIAVVAGTATPEAVTAIVTSLLSAVLFMYPSFAAWSISQTLPQKLAQAFGAPGISLVGKKPFRWFTLWFRSRIPEGKKETFTYARHGGADLRLHFFSAKSTAPAPCVIVIHTGGWDSGSPDEFEQMNRYLASEGYAVAAISYRFAPQCPWPAQREDALAAISFLKLHAERLGIDPLRFVLFGRSAGGQIAEAVAYSADDPTIKGCIGFYAPADLIFAYEHLSPEPDILDSRTLLHNYLGGSLHAKHDRYRDASSFHHVRTSSTPTLLIHGANDPLTWYRQSERLSARLTEQSVPNLYIELPWATHAFDYNFNGPGGQISKHAVISFLSSILSRR
jgi:acetyl esterase/lipase